MTWDFESVYPYLEQVGDGDGEDYQVDVYVEAPDVTVQAPDVVVPAAPDVHVPAPDMRPLEALLAELARLRSDLIRPAPPRPRVVRRVVRNADGLIELIVEEPDV